MNLGSLSGVNQDFVCLRSVYFRVAGGVLADVRPRGSGVGREIQTGCEEKAKQSKWGVFFMRFPLI